MSLVEKTRKRLSYLSAFIQLEFKALQLRRDARGLNSERLVALIKSEKWERYFWIKQITYEILKLTKIIEEKKPKVVVEIGTANGGSLFLFTKLSHPNALIISIDLPGGIYGGGYSWNRKNFYKSFASKTQTITLLREDSHSIKTLEKLKTILNGRKIDFLFIDGDHTYEGVKTDFELYQPLVDDEGLIALHDIAKHPESWGVEVDRFWNLQKQNYKWVEILEDPHQGWAGIGLLYMKKHGSQHH